MRHLANVIKLKCVANVSLQLVLCANFSGVGKNSPTILSRLWTKVHQIWGHVGLTSFFPIDIMFCCGDILGQSSKSVPKSIFCHPPAREGKHLGDYGPNFKNSSHK